MPRGLLLSLEIASLLSLALHAACGGSSRVQEKSADGRGGDLVVSLNSDPQSFNRLLATDYAGGAIGDLLSDDLVRVDRTTFELVPSLASSWEVAPDGRTYTIRLRPDLRFSDGSPVTVEDVLFTLTVVRDLKPPPILAEQLLVDGVFPSFEKSGESSIRLTFPRPVGVGLRGLDSLAILPKARLQQAYEENRLARAWQAEARPSEIVGTGPFRLREYRRGVKVVLERNPFYWKKDAQGRALPYLDTISFLIIPDRNAEALRFQAGELDLVQTLDAENYARLRKVGADVRLEDLGPGLQFDFLWFNLNRGKGRSGRPYVKPEKLAVFENPEFRRAVSMALDRASMARSILLGLGTPQYGPLSPGNKAWHHSALPQPDYSPARAREIVGEIGLRDSNRDGTLNLPSGSEFEITLFTSRGSQRREKIAQVIRDQLANIGIRVIVQPLDPNDLILRVRNSHEYEAMLFGFTPNDAVPDSLVDVWYSSGSNHFWYPNQPTPATPWEGEMDSLVERLVRTVDAAERRRLFDRVQEIWVREMPAIPTLSTNVLVAWKPRVGNIRPSILAPQLWWNAEELTVQ